MNSLDLKTRIKTLKKLKELIMFYQSDIEKVLYLDLKKTPTKLSIVKYL
ncbi:hypothetical protein [Mycoplasmopsis cynos]|nr:hypothetical protein [Mycoplasmopsis cynos]UWV82174.1 hypothetical protein NW067_03850 [Mycoplasmopsis cynos]UWV93420.1 hypothetical protein NW062_05620 [Mycoplasmopsis cynos]